MHARRLAADHSRGKRLPSRALFLLCAVGCAPTLHQVGKQATEGALQGAKEQAKEGNVQPLSANVTSAVARTILAEMDNPEQLEHLDHITRTAVGALLGGMVADRKDVGMVGISLGESVGRGIVSGIISGLAARRQEIASLTTELSTAAGDGFARAAFAHMRTELGDSGNGRLAMALGGASETVAAAALRGAGREFSQAASCDTQRDPDCVSAYVRRLSRDASAGAAEGVKAKTNMLQLGLAFGAGTVITVLGGWLFAYVLGQRGGSSPSPSHRERYASRG